MLDPVSLASATASGMFQMNGSDGGPPARPVRKYSGPRNSRPRRILDRFSTSEIADNRSTASFRISVFGAVVDAGSTSIIFLQPTAAVKAASSASGFRASLNAASSPPNGNGRAMGRLTVGGPL